MLRRRAATRRKGAPPPFIPRMGARARVHFSVAMELSDEQRALRATVREFAEAEIAPHAAAWDRNGTFPAATVRKLGELGIMGLPFPEQYGGLAAGTL